MMSHFVILAAPRTGSNLLCTLLDSHPEILCHHELFNPEGIFTSLAMRHLSEPFGSMQERDRDPLGFLQRVWDAGDRTAASCIGLKWTRGENETILRHVLVDTTVKKIVLRRRNRVKTYVSERIAQLTQQWEVYDARELVTSPRLRVDESDLRAHVQMNEDFYDDLEQALAASRQPVLQVEYESLFAFANQRQLLEFLEVKDVECVMQAASVKQNATDLRETIENFHELVTVLADSELAAELQDSSN